MLALTHGEVPLAGDQPVVLCLDAGSDAQLCAETLGALLMASGPSPVIVIYGAPGVLAAVGELIGPIDGRDVWSMAELRPGQGVAQVADAVNPADIVLLGADCRLVPGCLEALTSAAQSDLVVATASALQADLVDESRDAGLLRAEASANEAGGDAESDGPVTPGPDPGSLVRLEEPAGSFVYIRRSAIDLAGPATWPTFPIRCRERGLAHVLASDVIAAGGPPRGITSGIAARNVPGLTTARLRARVARSELSVLIDARALDGPLNGTRVHLCELIKAVAETGDASVTALAPAQMPDDSRRLLDRVQGVTLIPVDRLGNPPDGLRADVVHRPHQAHAAADLRLLGALAPRLVLTQQDLIELQAPSYFASEAGWRGYRELTRLALASADRVVFFSRHARAEALADELVEQNRADVVPLGADHVLASDGVVPSAPSGIGHLDPGAEMILCLGTDMQHKNRRFALALVKELQRAHAWQGTLVLAGPHVPYGSSRPEERLMLEADPALAASVLDIGEVSDAGRAWLLARAALVLYPTVHEGFGLVPYEAAAADTPCLWAPGTALAEMLGEDAGDIAAWDPVVTAARALRLMRDSVARSEHIASVRAAGARLRWAQTGHDLVATYRAACAGAPSPAGVIMRGSALMDGAVSQDGVRLVGPGGVLPRDAERALLAVLTRPRLAKPLLKALRSGYRIAHRRGTT